jgi:hypothetical protein
MRKDYHRRRLCQLYLAGEAYNFINDRGGISALNTGLGPTGRPLHRFRNRLNMIEPMVSAKVSTSTTRVPGYEVNPASTDPEDDAAARLSQKVLRAGYDRWYLGEARVNAVTTAIGGGGKAYALPYFDPMVGPFRAVEGDDGNVEMVGEGEIKVLILNGNQAYGEPGVEWHHSRWYAVEMARPIDEVRAMDGFNGTKITPDASTADTPEGPTEDMVLVTLYFERPCPKYPHGRMLTMVGGKQIIPEGPYPLIHQGKVLDEPCIHRLVYKLDPTDDNDLGLTWSLIDFQNTYQDCMNKALALKNLGLLPQLLAQKGTVRQEDVPTDEPGSIVWYSGSQPPAWRDPPNPALLGQLQQIMDRCLNDMRYVAADTDVEVAPNVAIGAVNAVIQQAANRWSQFVGHLAKWDSQVARHCLLLAQQHYSEDRILKVRGRYGWEPEASFRGADIMGQVDVYVNPATLETRTRQAMLQTLGWIQANFPGYVRPEIAIEIALNGASLEGVIESFELDKARANEIIQKIRDGSIMEMPDRDETMPGAEMPGPPDPTTGIPGPPVKGPPVMAQVPGWMPRKFDNVDVQAFVFEQWMKTPDASSLPQEMYAVAMLIYEGFKQLQSEQQAQAMAAQTMQAQELGEANAAKPQEKGMPSTPNPAGEGEPA